MPLHLEVIDNGLWTGEGPKSDHNKSDEQAHRLRCCLLPCFKSLHPSCAQKEGKRKVRKIGRSLPPPDDDQPTSLFPKLAPPPEERTPSQTSRADLGRAGGLPYLFRCGARAGKSGRKFRNWPWKGREPADGRRGEFSAPG